MTNLPPSKKYYFQLYLITVLYNRFKIVILSLEKFTEKGL